MTVYELISNTYKTQTVELNLVDYHKSTEETTVKNISLNSDENDAFDVYKYRKYDVVMFTPTKRGTLKIFGYAEHDD